MALKILLADDSMTAQNMGKKILTEAGYEVVPVSNGSAALKKLAEQKPDLLILDVYMPGYTGLEVCERVKSAAATADIPIILTVGKLEPFRPEEANKVKANGTIIKPFEATDLLAAVKTIEDKLAASSQPSPDDTQEIRPLVQEIPFSEFKDASYHEWKQAAEYHGEAAEEDARPVPQIAISEELGAAPALGLEEFAAEPPVSAVSQVELAPLVGGSIGETAMAAAAGAESAALSPVAVSQATPATEVFDATIVLQPDEPITFDVPVAAPPAAEPAPEFSIFEVPQSAAAPEPAPQAQISELTPEVLSEETIVLEPLAEVAPAQAAASAEAVAVFPAVLEPLGELIQQEITSSEPVLEPLQRQPATAQIAYDGIGTELELTAAPAVEVPASDLVPEFEPTILPAQDAPDVAPDAALVTDMQQIATDFVTTFGQADPEIVPVGVVSETPTELEEIVIEPAAAGPEIVLDEIAEPSAVLEELVVETEDAGQSAPVVEPVATPEPELALEPETAEVPAIQAAPVELEAGLQAVAPAEAEVPEAEVAEVLPEPSPAAPGPTGVDEDLAKELEAAITNRQPSSPPVAEAAAIAEPTTLIIDKTVVEELVGRVLARLKPALVAEITRELEADRKN